jgi:hypothetical protein
MRAMSPQSATATDGRSLAGHAARHAEGIGLFVCAVFGVIHAWIERYAMNPDGMSYLDMGDALFRHEWGAAINAYWSPLYPALLGATLRVLHPTSRWEFPVVQFLNLLIYLAALFCFRFFLRSVQQSAPLGGDSGSNVGCPLPNWVTYATGYGLFLWSSTDLITIRGVSPDMLVAATVYLIAGLLIRLRESAALGRYCALGCVLGIAYWAKAVMFVLGFLFLAIAFFATRKHRHHVVGMLIATLVFASICAPWVLLISRAKGHFTFGESGKLNYAWMVSPNTFWRNWQGVPPTSGVPRHATRQLLADPPLFEFDGPIEGTYPVWYDPSYWNDGLQPQFELRPQIRVLLSSTLVYMRLLFHEQLGLLCGMLVLILISGSSLVTALRPKWPMIALAVVPMGLYALVHVDDRYVGAYVVLFWMTVLASVRLPHEKVFTRVANYIGIAVIATLLLSAFNGAAAAIMHPEGYSAFADIQAAEALQKLGMQPGDRIAIMGDGTGAFWAHLARLKIVAEIMSGKAAGFWTASPERKALVYSTFARTSAKIIVCPQLPPGEVAPGWQAIPGTNFYTYSLSNNRR